jgi:hypothetical protein
MTDNISGSPCETLLEEGASRNTFDTRGGGIFRVDGNDHAVKTAQSKPKLPLFAPRRRRSRMNASAGGGLSNTGGLSSLCLGGPAEGPPSA